MRLVMRLATVAAVAAVASGSSGNETGRRPMLWMHIHNAGGTTIRTLAELYGERPIQPATQNWNIGVEKYGDDIVWSCEAKRRLMESQVGASWTAIERPLEAADLGCDFDYGVTVRDPVATMVSTLVNNRVDASKLFRILGRARGKPLAGVPVPRLAKGSGIGLLEVGTRAESQPMQDYLQP